MSEEKDPYEYIPENWKKIRDNLVACIDASLDDGLPKEAIKYMLLLEQVIYAQCADKYEFGEMLK